MSDPRLTPARPDLAAANLKGTVQATAFVDGKPMTIARGRTALRHAPEHEALQDDELLFGEVFTVYDSKGGWAWGQSAVDGYVGYVHTIVCGDPIEPTHRVVALVTPLLTGPDIKRATRDLLPLNAQVKVLERANGFARIAPDGYVFSGHLAPLDVVAGDWVATAERFVGTAYVWGGKTHAGIDCSGLVQTALASAGIASPRDTDLQEKALGQIVPFQDRRRGDLVFWSGHVGILLDEARLLHANSFRMQVDVEPLDDVIVRMTSVAGPVTTVKRL
ncbi:MAG TPA: C40 family peptidase [Rhizomicrobium sp.]|nr:C40 family peptidase [Rhizomicrobium sp.]